MPRYGVVPASARYLAYNGLAHGLRAAGRYRLVRYEDFAGLQDAVRQGAEVPELVIVPWSAGDGGKDVIAAGHQRRIDQLSALEDRFGDPADQDAYLESLVPGLTARAKSEITD